MLLATATIAQQPNNDSAVGREWAAEIERRGTKFLDDPVVSEYMNRLGLNIALNSDWKGELPTTRVVNSMAINALVLPGGFLYINAGLILAADNEAQLAGMMAHMLAHVAARRTRGSLPSPRSTRTLPPQFYKFTPQSEEEADWLGVQYLYKAGYDPTALVNMLQKLNANEIAGQVPISFDTHIPTELRLMKANDNINRILPKRQQNVVTTTEFQTVKARVMALIQ